MDTAFCNSLVAGMMVDPVGYYPGCRGNDAGAIGKEALLQAFGQVDNSGKRKDAQSCHPLFTKLKQTRFS